MQSISLRCVHSLSSLSTDLALPAAFSDRVDDFVEPRCSVCANAWKQIHSQPPNLIVVSWLLQHYVSVTLFCFPLLWGVNLTADLSCYDTAALSFADVYSSVAEVFIRWSDFNDVHKVVILSPLFPSCNFMQPMSTNHLPNLAIFSPLLNEDVIKVSSLNKIQLWQRRSLVFIVW